MDLKSFTDGDLLYASKLNENFKKINDKVEEDTGWVSIFMQHGIGAGKISVRKIGKLVVFSGDSVVGSATIQNQVKIWDIPQQFKPSKNGFAFLLSPFTDEIVKLQYDQTKLTVIVSSGSQATPLSFANLFWVTD